MNKLIFRAMFLFLCACSNDLKFELTDQGEAYTECLLHDDFVPCYRAIYLVSNYNEKRDSTLFRFVQDEFKKANENHDSIRYVGLSFYKKTQCTKKFLSQNPYGESCNW